MFRSGGIYVLPNGRELIAAGDGSSFLAVAKDRERVQLYEVNESGRLSLEGRLTAWDLTNLRDSGRTVEIPTGLQPLQIAEFVNQTIA